MFFLYRLQQGDCVISRVLTVDLGEYEDVPPSQDGAPTKPGR